MSESLRSWPNVLNIPTGVSFAETLAAELLRQSGGDPLKLAEMVVLLPNRRACRTLQEAFLRQAMHPHQSGASLLPRLMPIGDLDGEDLEVLGGAILGAAAIPPSIGELKRRMLLARLIMAARRRGGSDAPAIRLDQASQLAAELARLLDQVLTERKDLSALDGIVPQDLAEHWQLTIDFLDILRRAWPDILEAEGAIDPADRRNCLLDLQRELWTVRPPTTPVIAAGSTGSIPAAADLMHVVARLPQGAVYLPGLDRAPDAEDWIAIEGDPSHPQYGLAQLLKRFALTREAVADVAVATPEPARAMRAKIVSAALLPADRTHGWKERAEALGDSTPALAEVQRIDCQSQAEEALIIALALRRFLAEHESGIAALATPDRRLARRVAAALKRWQIEIDDSAGQPLSQTAPGTFLIALSEAVESGWAPIPLLGLLKHPLAGAGRSLGSARRLARGLDRGVLRGPRPAPGWGGLRDAIAARERKKQRPYPALHGIVDALERATVALQGWDQKLPPVQRLRGLIAAAEALAATDAERGADRLWRDEAGEALANFAHDALLSFKGLPAVDAIDFTALMLELLSGIAVRPRYGKHPRLFIWGALEARLQQADLLVLGGLNDGTWPAEAAIDPWMSRPMRQKASLPVPERRIGLSAHDFQQAMGARRVLLTRAERVDGAPSVPSRWLLRLDAFLRCTGDGLPNDVTALERRLAHRIDLPAKVVPSPRPMPRPGAKWRPTQLSVTKIETWRRNPYGIYARHILDLKALDPLDQDPGVADLGTAVHTALHEFTSQHPHALPSDAIALLRAEGERAFQQWLDRPNVWAFWQPRFQRIAAWWLKVERARRPRLASIATEIEGTLDVPAIPPFTLTARADRIDIHQDGALTVIDYKTGTLPKKDDIKRGFAPQLSLEAAMALAGAFPGINASQIAELSYWKLSGNRDGGKEEPVPGDLMDLATTARAGLAALIAEFSGEDAVYTATPDAAFAPAYDDYEHLARNTEWLSERELWP